MCGSTALVQRKALVTLNRKIVSHSSSGMSSVRRITEKPPALLTSTSTRPHRLITASTARRTSPAAVTSTFSGIASRPWAASSRASPSTPSAFTSSAATRAPSRPNARATRSPMPLAAPVTMATLPSNLMRISHRGAAELATERHQRPRPTLRVPAEADVAGERVLVAEEPLDGVAVVDAVGAGQRVERVHGVRAELHRVGDVALEAELFLERGRATRAGDVLGVETVGADDEPGRVDHGAGAAHAKLHGLEVAHARARVVGAALADRVDRHLQRGLGVADGGRRQAVRAQGRQRHLVERVRVGARAGELIAPARQVHAECPVLGDEDLTGPDRLGAGAAHTEHVPVVDDLVVALRHQAHAMVDDALAVLDHDGEHVPVAGIDAAREVPESGDDEAAVDAAAATLRIGDA